MGGGVDDETGVGLLFEYETYRVRRFFCRFEIDRCFVYILRMRDPTPGVVPRCHFVNIATQFWEIEK